MHEYMTRHMVALQPMTYADMTYDVGDLFLATPVDEPYLARAGRARSATPAEVPTRSFAPPPVTETAPAEEPAPVMATQPIADAEPTPAAAEPVSTPTRRPYTRRNQASSAD